MKDSSCKMLNLIRYDIHKSCPHQDAAERIRRSSVASAILNPDETGNSFGKRKLARKTIGDKTLEVVYIKEDDIIVITVYWLEET